jgi:hypothetical protein
VTSSAAGRARRPLYARLLRLRYLHPGPVACFLLFEGTIALGALLALAELVDWPVVILLPAGVALMVKLNDVLAGATLPRFGRGRRAHAARGHVARGTAVVVDSTPVPPKNRVVGKAPAPAVERLPGAAPTGSAAVERLPGAAPTGSAAVTPDPGAAAPEPGES